MTSNKIEEAKQTIKFEILVPLVTSQVTKYQEEQGKLTKASSHEEYDTAIKVLNKTYLELVLEIIGEDEEKKVMEWDCPCGTQHHSETSYHNRNGLRAELRNALNQRLGEDKEK